VLPLAALDLQSATPTPPQFAEAAANTKCDSCKGEITYTTRGNENALNNYRKCCSLSEQFIHSCSNK